MNIDCLRHILLYCDTNGILKLNSVNKLFNVMINDDEFWKLIMFRDFKDINKLDTEKWLDYYKRRSINYGIPITINNYVYQYNQVKQFLTIDKNMKKLNLILTKTNELYIINNNGFIKINHDKKIKKIYGAKNFYVVDDNNCLYELLYDHSLLLLRSEVNNVIVYHHNKDCYTKLDYIYYADKKYTYYLNNGVKQRIFDFPILDLINLQGIDYIINEENLLIIGKLIDKKYNLDFFNLKASQLSYINSKIVIILGLDGFVRICNNNKFRQIKIPNVSMLGCNSFLTKNGDLYYFDKTYKPTLIDTDVIDVSYITNNGEEGCYVKRYII